MSKWPTIEAKLIKGRYYLKEKNMKKKLTSRKELPALSAARKSNSKKYKYRSSITGRFVTEKYAKKHPKTTEKELIK